MVEMTIVIPIAISLMAGGVDFGWWVSTQATGSKSVRDAARYLATLPTSISICTNAQAVENAQSLAAYGKFGGVDGVDTPLVPGWQMNGGTNNNVTVRCDTDPSTCPEAPVVSCPIVTAHFLYTSMILASFLPVASQYTLTARHEEVQVGDD
jgi:Flp pilus assembly protein TadG